VSASANPPTCGCRGGSVNLTQAECTAWIAIFDKTGGQQWKYCKDSRLDPCNCRYNNPKARGVTCPKDGASITSVDLAHNNLRGPLPEELVALTRLNHLALDYNHLYSSIPESFSALIGLKYLAMEGNWLLNGSIPESISALTRLITLDLKLNTFTGPVPALPFEQYTYCSLQSETNPSNHFICPLPPVSTT
jgi:Leucine-rich repeat (LRR) protein